MWALRLPISKIFDLGRLICEGLPMRPPTAEIIKNVLAGAQKQER